MKIKLRRKFAAALLAVLLSLNFASCGNENSSADKTTNESTNSITVGINNFHTNLDPASEFNGWFVSRFGIGETLVKFNENMEIEPSLADSWERLDSLTWRFHIREGVKFHNGKEVTAKNVKSSLERALKLNPRTQDLLFIDNITAEGQNLTITTKAPHEALLGNIAEPITTIVDTSLDKTTLNKAPICTGPFKVKPYNGSSEVVVEKNEDYWGDKASLNKVIFKYIQDDNTRSMALQSGEIDAATNIPSTNMTLFQNNNNYTIDKISSLRIIMSYVNLEKDLLKDPALRKAMALGVDRETYANTLLNGSALPAVGSFPGSLPFGNKNLKGYKYDKALATKILNDAGYKDTDGDGILEKDGENIELNLAFYTTRSELPIIAEAMQAQLKEIGIGIKLQSYETVSKVLSSGDFDLCLYSVNTATSGDPQGFLETYFKTGGSENYGKYSNKEVDELIDKLRVEQDTKKRHEIAIEVQQRLIDDNACIFLVTPMLNIISKSSISGLKMYPIDYYILNNNVSIKDEQ